MQIFSHLSQNYSSPEFLFTLATFLPLLHKASQRLYKVRFVLSELIRFAFSYLPYHRRYESGNCSISCHCPGCCLCYHHCEGDKSRWGFNWNIFTDKKGHHFDFHAPWLCISSSLHHAHTKIKGRLTISHCNRFPHEDNPISPQWDFVLCVWVEWECQLPGTPGIGCWHGHIGGLLAPLSGAVQNGWLSTTMGN